MLLPHTEPPLFKLVTQSDLASQFVGSPITSVNPLHINGLCTSADYGTIRPGVVLRNAGTDLLSTLSRPCGQTVARPHKFHVVSVLVRVAMTQLCTGAVIAHELMHAYLRMRGVRSATAGTRDVEEGICNLMAYLWLERQPPQVR